MRNTGIVAALTAAAHSAAAIGPIVLTIDPAQSPANFELCALGNCDTDSSSIIGQMTIDLDHPTSPTQTNLYDYQFTLADDLAFFLDFGLGGITVTANDLMLTYPDPGIPTGPAPIAGGMFQFTNVPVLVSGSAEYVATLLACTFLQIAGLPCEDQIDLTTLGEQSADSLVGMIVIAGNDVTVTIDVELSLSVVPSNPDLAQLHFSASLLAHGTLPECGLGDFDCDGVVDLIDYGAYLDCESGAGGGILLPGCETFDFDGDEDVDLHDYADFQVAFTGP